MFRYLKKAFLFNSSRYRLYEENKAFVHAMPKGSLVLDAGAGEQPYRHLMAHVIYESADFEQVDKPYLKSTYVCDLKQIPVENERFDFILFNQVMEHLPEPQLVLQELHRVLKPGGKLLYTAPLFYEEHEIPYDFFRYTQFSIKKLFSESGFALERLDWLEGYYGTVGYQLNRMARYLPLKPQAIAKGIWGWIYWPFIFLTKIFSMVASIIFHKMEVRFKFTQKGYPKNYLGIFIKPAGVFK